MQAEHTRRAHGPGNHCNLVSRRNWITDFPDAQSAVPFCARLAQSRPDGRTVNFVTTIALHIRLLRDVAPIAAGLLALVERHAHTIEHLPPASQRSRHATATWVECIRHGTRCTLGPRTLESFLVRWSTAGPISPRHRQAGASWRKRSHQRVAAPEGDRDFASECSCISACLRSRVLRTFSRFSHQP